MKNSLPILFVCMVVLISACSGSGANYNPIVDTAGSSAAQSTTACVEYNRDGTCAATQYVPGRDYNADLNACRGIATQADPVKDAATSGAIGAIVGAAGGAAIGAILGRPGTGAAIGAAGGAIGGTAQGGLSGTQKQEQIVRDCMRGRGWNVF